MADEIETLLKGYGRCSRCGDIAITLVAVCDFDGTVWSNPLPVCKPCIARDEGITEQLVRDSGFMEL